MVKPPSVGPKWLDWIVEEVVEWWHGGYRPMEGSVERVLPWRLSFWWGRRWRVVYDDGVMCYEPYYRYLTHKQMAMRSLRKLARAE